MFFINYEHILYFLLTYYAQYEIHNFLKSETNAIEKCFTILENLGLVHCNTAIWL